MALVGLHQHRQEGADAEIDPAPADVEGPFPLLPRVGEHAAAAADAGIVEQQMDPVGRLLLGELVTKALELVLDRDVGEWAVMRRPCGSFSTSHSRLVSAMRRRRRRTWRRCSPRR